jgi:hypothetical protein
MKWLNALGLLLQFISFWLAAPELIGDNGLKRMQKMLENFVSNFSIIFLGTIMMGYILFFSINGILRGLDASEKGITTAEMTRYYISVGIATLVYLAGMLRYKKIKLWIDQKIAVPVIENYIQNHRLRRNSLLAGAALFTFGFLIQFIIILILP